MAQFHIDRRLDKSLDIQRQYLFEVKIPKPDGLNSNEWPETDLIIRARSVSVPSRGNTPIQTDFFGMKKFYPGQSLFGHTVDVEFESHQDQLTVISLENWNQLIFNLDFNDANAGTAKSANRSGVVSNIEIKQYGFNGDQLEKSATLYNAFLENVQDSPFAYATNESVKYTATFHFDYWLLTTPTAS